MSSLVEHLRLQANAEHNHGRPLSEILEWKAADRIEKLEGGLKQMLDAIERGSIDSPEIGGEDGIPVHKWHEEWEHNARTALAEKEGV